jgi:hypothetical protein
MNKIRKNESGFSAIEAILIIVIVVAVAGVGWFVWHSKQVADKNLAQANSTSPTFKKSQKKTSTVVGTPGQTPSTTAVSKSLPGMVNLADATQFTKDFYDTYFKNVPVNNGQISTVQKYGTSNLEFYYNYYQHGFDPIVCAEATPTSVTAKGISTSNGVASVDITENYGSGGPVLIHAQVVFRDSLKIDSVSCTGNDGNLPPPPAMN